MTRPKTTPGRRPSWWLRILDKSNVTVTAATAIAVLYSRSVGVAYFSIGALVCSGTAKVVKRFIKQERPAHPSQRKKTYGMPSTHSATITFFATYITLAALYLPIHSAFPSDWRSRVLPPLLVLPCASLIAASRLWLGHHTLAQIVAGVGLGIFMANGWYAVWVHGGLNEYGKILEDQFIRTLPF